VTWEQVSASGCTYSAWITRYEPGGHDDTAAGSAGVREPRRPIQPRYSGGAALPLPRHDDAPLSSMIFGGPSALIA